MKKPKENNDAILEEPPQKKQKIEETNVEDQEEEGELITDFELIDPQIDYIENVKMLLKTSELFKEITCFDQLAETICNQQNIGKFVRIADDEDNIIGLLTFINIEQYVELKEIKKMLLGKLDKVKPKKNEIQSGKPLSEHILKLKNILYGNVDKKKNVGLVISHRIINSPIEIAPMLYENVLEDVHWSLRLSDMPRNEKKFYHFSSLLFFTKVYKSDKQELFFFNFEEQHFFENCSNYCILESHMNVKKFHEVVNNKFLETSYKEFLIIFEVAFEKMINIMKKLNKVC